MVEESQDLLKIYKMQNFLPLTFKFWIFLGKVQISCNSVGSKEVKDDYNHYQIFNLGANLYRHEDLFYICNAIKCGVVKGLEK